MKKLVIIAAITLGASLANAAQCQWSATGIYADPVGTALTGYTAYLCDASVYTAAIIAEDLANGDFSKLNTEGYVQNTATTAAQGTTGNARIASVRFGDYNVGDTKTFYTIIMNGVADAATYFTISADVEYKVPSSGYLAMSFTNLSENAAVGWTETVPEPTSALMLLLGMAGLALKRKVA